jgi:hypothetical protein
MEKGRRIQKAQEQTRFEHYSDQRWGELARMLGRDDPELRERIEGLGQRYLRHRQLENWWPTPIKRAKELDKLLVELARAKTTFFDSGVVLTGGRPFFPGMTVEAHLRGMREEVQRRKDSAEQVIASLYDDNDGMRVTCHDPLQFELPAPAQEMLDKLQRDIDLHEAWANVFEKTEGKLRPIRGAIESPPSQSAENRDETTRNMYFVCLFNLWCKAKGAAPPIEGRWQGKRAAIDFLNAAAEPVIEKLAPTAIRNWLTTYVATYVEEERSWSECSEGLPDWKLVSVHQYEG